MVTPRRSCVLRLGGSKPVGPALATHQQAADVFLRPRECPHHGAGHTDTSGPEAYNMALSLRRANAVKDALVRDGVPAQAITVIGKGESQLLVRRRQRARPQKRPSRSSSSKTIPSTKTSGNGRA